MRRLLLRILLTLGLSVVCLCTTPAKPLSSTLPDTSTPPPIQLDDTRLPTPDEFRHLAETNPLAALKASLKRYKLDGYVGYRATLLKQERNGGVLHGQEKIQVRFRESPFSVLMLWQSGARRVGLGTVQGTLLVDGKMIAWRPDALLKEMSADPRGKDARAAARFSILEFGIYAGTERTYRAWEAAQQRGKLQCEFVGTMPVAELDGRICHVIRRTCDTDEVDAFLQGESYVPTKANEVDAFRTVTIMLDAKTFLQIGSELKRANGELVASYYFKDIQKNPRFTKEDFSTTSFKKP
jgi:hypothetical protein